MRQSEPDLIPKNELVFDSFEDCMAVLKATTQNEVDRTGDYCVLVSREENLYVLNFQYSNHCDRNNVVFMDRDEFEDVYVPRFLVEGNNEED